MQQKMTFYDQRGPASFKGRDYYENLCMRTLNQAVGRALRHANDYAAILLVDARFNTSAQVRGKLPSWLQRKLLTDLPMHAALTELKTFFQSKTLSQ